MSELPSENELIAFIAANVRRIRLREGLTQEQLAERAALDETYIQRVEAGLANPTARALLKLARGLGVTLPQLLKRAKPQTRTTGRPQKRSGGPGIRKAPEA